MFSSASSDNALALQCTMRSRAPSTNFAERSNTNGQKNVRGSWCTSGRHQGGFQQQKSNGIKGSASGSGCRLRSIVGHIVRADSRASFEIISEYILRLSANPTAPVTPAPADSGRRRGSRTLLVACSFLLALFLWFDLLGLRQVEGTDLARTLMDNCWIGYDPSDFHPVENPNPSDASIHSDLREIRNAGFTGIVTFSSRGTLARIPAIAKQEGLATIMGVWDPMDNAELDNATRQRDFVVGYSIGQGRVEAPNSYHYEDLERAIPLVRNRTNRPVTTSEQVRMYRDNPRLDRMGDWIFPSCSLSFAKSVSQVSQVQPDVSLDRDVDEFMKYAQEIAAVAKRWRKPLALKMVAYPWSGIG
jgi:hypothetical protein